MNKLKVKTPVYSHWGISGGDFFKSVGYEKLSGQKWQFLQTRFSFMQKDLGPFPKKVLAKAVSLFPNKIDNDYIKSPAGFIHAFDLTLILAEAWQKLDKKGNWQENLKKILEAGDFKVQGLIKNYSTPFSTYDVDSPDAHEALGKEDLKMAEFNSLGQIILK